MSRVSYWPKLFRSGDLHSVLLEIKKMESMMPSCVEKNVRRSSTHPLGHLLHNLAKDGLYSKPHNHFLYNNQQDEAIFPCMQCVCFGASPTLELHNTWAFSLPLSCCFSFLLCHTFLACKFHAINIGSAHLQWRSSLRSSSYMESWRKGTIPVTGSTLLVKLSLAVTKLTVS
jgi:hypothetical protein